MERKTPLYDVHVAEGGKMVPFAGYLLPVQYGTGVIQEHMAVRQQAGLFDVSHMGEILFTGPTALDTLNHLLTNDYSGMPVNKVRYGVMCNAQGGTIDDLVVYKFGEEAYLAVVNASNREKDYAHMAQNLLPDLGKYKLDIVAEYLDLPAFNHHRASDDAAMVAYMLIPFFQKMEKELGIRRLQDINPQMLKLRPRGSKSSRFPKHIILLAKNKMGLKHLYQLISASNLQYFKRVPIIPKTELMAHREGLIVGSACEAGELFQAVKDHKDWAELRRIASF